MARKLLPMKMAAWHQGTIYEQVAQNVRMKPADGIGQHCMIGNFEHFIRHEYITIEDQNNPQMRGEIDPTTYIMKMLPVEKAGVCYDQTTRRELSDGILEKSVILESEIRNSQSEVHALGVFGDIMPFTVRHKYDQRRPHVIQA